jgi:hypothetical protein
VIDELTYLNYKNKLIAGTKLPSIIRSNLALEYLNGFEKYYANEQVLSQMMEENNPDFLGYCAATTFQFEEDAPRIEFKPGYDEFDAFLQILENRVAFKQAKIYKPTYYCLCASCEPSGLYQLTEPKTVELLIKEFERTLKHSNYKYISSFNAIHMPGKGRDWQFVISGGSFTREEIVAQWKSNAQKPLR